MITCEEASSLSKETYIPCGAKAEFEVDNGDTHTYNMCHFCTEHNVTNRGATVVGYATTFKKR